MEAHLSAGEKADPDYYVWPAPRSRISIRLKLDLVDRILAGVMTGFGAVPRRGAEVGGVLLGKIEPGDPTVVAIEDFEPVPCSYKRGPSYLLSELDRPLFESVVEENRTPEASLKPVGYYRSHTRDGLSLGDDDREICARFFPPPFGVALIIRPYATKTSTAGFVVYEEGELADWPSHEFPFRHSELTGGAQVPRTPLAMTPRRSGAAASESSPSLEPAAKPEPHAVPLGFSLGGYVPAPERLAAPAPTQEPKRVESPTHRVWIWIPLSFVFLMLGVLLGFFAAQTGFPLGQIDRSDPFQLGLSASRVDNNLLIRWDRNGTAIRNSRRGALHIVDGTFTKDLNLSTGELQTGTVIFHNTGDHVSVRLDVIVGEHSVVTESIDWKQ